MAHRDVSIIVSGAVLGLIIGAGSLSAVGGSAEARVTDPTTDVRYHEAPNPAYFRIRNVSKRGVPFVNDNGVYNYPTVKEGAAKSTASSAAGEVTLCDATKTVVLKLQKTFNAVVPQNFGNTALRAAMAEAFADAMDDHCSPEASADAMEEAAPTGPTVDNDCEKYGKKTARYTKCVFAEKNGVPYSGK